MAFHQQLKNVLFDVEVPDGLKESVLDSLQQHDADDISVRDHSQESSRTRFHKRPGTIAGLSACLLFAALLTYFWAAQQPVIALSEFSPEQNPEFNLDSRLLPDFDDNFSAKLPLQGAWHAKDRLSLIGDKFFGLSPSQSSTHDAAVGFFRLRMGNTSPVFVALVQIPAYRVEPLPSQTRFDTGSVEYAQLKKGNYATVKWIEDDRVYICIVFGGPRELEALGRALQSSTA
ncbi:hypothetical protein Pan241w_23670 [Gimesia alba]|uniref:Uncharacterized protein n=1 Tax=Gimesia alba TaxID=2527973 RepID=A0A517REJ3_9PLAN|nr:hypothetical protein [Gimesia alba]QDT42284.1 hypothetical protein Pan241w_23670 [Gimesia alba]